MARNFTEWMSRKQEVDALAHTPPFVSVGDVWWASVGENVGSEINGKSALFSRPVIILKKLAHGFYFVIPTSTKEKVGSWYVSFTHQGVRSVACLHQSRAIDHRRVLGKIGTLDDADLVRVKKGFHELFS
jgi:mRNA interferase MazF